MELRRGGKTSCRVGGIIRVGDRSKFSLKMGGDGETHNRGELLGLWMVLFFANYRHLDSLNIFGDSKLIIDWANGRGNLRALVSEGWKSYMRHPIHISN
jgi:ribonuclease HI